MAETKTPPAAGDRVVPMRVIVCGLHRTGTLTMRTALRQLGFHDCYHMLSVIDRPTDEAPQWVRALEHKYAGRGAFGRDDWDRLLGRCQASCDIPAALFSCELADTYPDAKVVVLVRDPERWYESVSGSIVQALSPRGLGARLARLYTRLFDDETRSWHRLVDALALAMPYNHVAEHDRAIAWFEARYAEFRARIPAERRIDFRVTDGWAPLCAHLGVPVPTVHDQATGELVEAPFPHANDRASFAVAARRADARRVARANARVLNFAGRACLVAGLAWAGYLAWTTRLAGRL